MKDRGSATVFVLALSMLVGLCVAAGLARGIAIVARHRADAAADLAALAAAQSVLDGPGRACAEADRVARENGGYVNGCEVSGDVVDVQVSRVLQVGGLGRWVVVGRARAGPAAEG